MCVWVWVCVCVGGCGVALFSILHGVLLIAYHLPSSPPHPQDVVLAEKPTISEETDLLEPVLLNELICHIATLASVYHKPPSAFVEGKVPVRRITLQPRAEP